MAPLALPGYAYALALPSEIFCVRHCSDESFFSFQMHLLVDHSKIMVYKALPKRFFSVEIEPSTSFCLYSIAD